MNRTKSKPNTDVCADCGASDPTWTSVNRGILLCVQCCCIHRDLGRHISQVKSLQHSHWSNSLLSLVQTLNNSGVNNIWEHQLLENSFKLNKRKPVPKDSLDVKAEFIKAKHKHCAFVFRPNNEDGLLCVENELGKQLHASVRTNNLETSFRFLIQGADPNYFHDEKGSTPLHVAAKKNQLLQAELLIVYGADPTYPDVHGNTPIDYAKAKGHKELMNRLIECKYDVTDKFSNYLCHRKPDHQNGVHLLIPQNFPPSNPIVINKLKRLPNHLFEELAMDVYDEIDRREIEAIWLSSSDSVKLNALPFLPVDPTLSTTRNQSRQKLGKFSSPELKALVYDILIDGQRRQNASEKESLMAKGISIPKMRDYSHISDDDPVYDSVASDDDYAVVAGAEQTDDSIDDRDSVKKSTSDSSQSESKDSVVDLDGLTQKLQKSDSTISTLKQEVSNLRAVIEKLHTENYELRTRLSQAGTNSVTSFNGDSGCSSLDGFLMVKYFISQEQQPLNGPIPGFPDLRSGRKSQRPLSMFETREGLKTTNWQDLKNKMKQTDQIRTTTSLYNNSSQIEQVIQQCTEQITKSIQQLIQCIQGSDRENCLLYADKVRYAVTHLSAIIPEDNKGETVRRLLESVSQMQVSCSSLQTASKNNDEQQIVNINNSIRNSAYAIAKETKQIVTAYTTR
ncbi:g protein-coupled receptor kinase interacting arfgap [Holotrichia oblita]|uniref:G protein-coupled receptor kinase interacting arfgap n=1 Tax=Holotrichia oblita TaxID=644536 RepID=A0ACB9T2Y9_HOLOL|nr:g protein-coupled receptor kinase interacting arfgap [Holotrichia oblita]